MGWPRMNNPWLKFYPIDWRGDPKLRMCSMAARGLWIEMLALMHEASPYGHLLINGTPPTDRQIAVLAGAPSDQITDLLGELEAAGVFSRTKDRVIYSRRMVRDEKRSALSRKNGGKGGNPSLGKDTGNRPQDNPKDNGGDKPQKPYSTIQNEKPNGFSERASARKPPGFVEVRKTTHAINDLIEEIRNDAERIGIGSEGHGGDVPMLPAIRAGRS